MKTKGFQLCLAFILGLCVIPLARMVWHPVYQNEVVKQTSVLGAAIVAAVNDNGTPPPSTQDYSQLVDRLRPYLPNDFDQHDVYRVLRGSEVNYQVHNGSFSLTLHGLDFWASGVQFTSTNPKARVVSRIRFNWPISRCNA